MGRDKAIPIRGWKIRFDAPPGGGLSRRAEPGDILALFRAWDDARAGKEPVDRRRNPRYTPAETRAWAGWWRGSHFLITPTELINLSKGGTLVHLPRRPPIAQPVWVCLGAPHPLEYAQARALDVSPRPEGGHRARLEFHEPCPPAFFLAAGQRVDAPATPGEGG